MRCNQTEDIPTNKKVGTHIVIMLIEVWKIGDMLKYMDEPPNNRAPVLLAECESFQVQENYRQTVCGMELKLPKGTMLLRTIANEKDVEDADNKAYVNWGDGGAVVVPPSKGKVSLADPSDFEVGSRIRIYAAYTTDWNIWELRNRNHTPNIFTDNTLLKKYKDCMDKVFDGFITQCSPSAPLVIKGQNLMTIFKKVSCPNRTASQGATLKEILDPKGTWRLLTTKGQEIIKLHSTNSLDKLGDVHIAPAILSNEMTIADAFAEWSNRFGLYFRILEENNEPRLKIGYTYTSGAIPGGTDVCICQNVDGNAPVIYFDYNVANDGLSYIDTDPYYIMIKCTVPITRTKGGRGKFVFHLKLETSGKYEMVDMTYINRKGIKTKSIKPYFKHSNFTIIDRIYPETIPESQVEGKKGEMKMWAIKQFEDAINNGLSGSLTLFGDLGLHTGELVDLNDKRHKKRNGRYIVEEVITSVSTEGLRQQIKIPYKLR